MSQQKLVGIHIIKVAAAEKEKRFEGVHARVAVGEVDGGEARVSDCIEIGSHDQTAPIDALRSALGDLGHAKVALALPSDAVTAVSFVMPAPLPNTLPSVLWNNLSIGSPIGLDCSRLWWTFAPDLRAGEQSICTMLVTHPEVMASYVALLRELQVSLAWIFAVTICPLILGDAAAPPRRKHSGSACYSDAIRLVLADCRQPIALQTRG